MAATTKPPRVPPSPNSMAARAAAAPENQRSLTKVQEVALLYRRMNTISRDVDKFGPRSEIRGLSEVDYDLWSAVAASARAVLMQKPETHADLLLQMVTVAGWMEMVFSSIEEEGKLAHKMAEAMRCAISEATLFLRKDVPIDALSPQIAEFVSELLEAATLDDPLAEEIAA